MGRASPSRRTQPAVSSLQRSRAPRPPRPLSSQHACISLALVRTSAATSHPRRLRQLDGRDTAATLQHHYRDQHHPAPPSTTQHLRCSQTLRPLAPPSPLLSPRSLPADLAHCTALVSTSTTTRLSPPGQLPFFVNANTVCAASTHRFLFELLKRECLSLHALPVTLECPTAWAGPRSRCTVPARPRGCSAANDCTDRPSCHRSVVEVLTDCVPRFSFHPFPALWSAT